jgi:hypothetical protein
MTTVKMKYHGNNLRCKYIFRDLSLCILRLARSIHLDCSFSGELVSFIPTNSPILGSRDSSVGIATVYGLDGRGIGVRVPIRAVFYVTSSSSRPVLGPTQPPIQWVPGDDFPRGKAAGA